MCTRCHDFNRPLCFLYSLLEAFQAAFTTVETLKVTGTAIRDAAALNLGRQEVVGIPQTLCPAHFYKSTTSDAD